MGNARDYIITGKMDKSTRKLLDTISKYQLPISVLYLGEDFEKLMDRIMTESDEYNKELIKNGNKSKTIYNNESKCQES